MALNGSARTTSSRSATQHLDVPVGVPAMDGERLLDRIDEPVGTHLVEVTAR